MTMDWYRWHHGTQQDAKLSMIAKQIGVRRCEMTAVWDEFMDFASRNVTRGHIVNIDLEVVAFAQEVSIENVRKIYQALEEKGVITNGVLTSWKKRQPEREDPTAAERQREKRARDKAKKAAQLSLGHAPSRTVTTDKIRLDKIRLDKKESILPNSIELNNLNLPIQPRAEKNGEVLKNSNFGGLDVRHYLTDKTLDEVKKFYGIRLGWDVQWLISQYNSWREEKKKVVPKNWNRAFTGWCKTFTKDKPPP